MLYSRAITEMDELFLQMRPNQIKIDEFEGRIIYAQEPYELFVRFDPEQERMITAPELVRLRCRAFNYLNQSLFDDVNMSRYEKAAKALEIFEHNSNILRIWQIRLTVQSHLVRTEDQKGNDKIFVYHGNPFENQSALIRALLGELSDGGFRYTEYALNVICSCPGVFQYNYTHYLSAQGGNFSGKDFLTHLLFNSISNGAGQMNEYIFCLQMLDHLLGFYHRGIYSGWRPGNMKSNFGRLIALGLFGEAFYPPNNNTVGHAALVTPAN